MGGFWRYLYENGEIKKKEPPEDWDPFTAQMNHISRIHEGVPQHECKICAVWTVVCECWQTARDHENFVRKAAREFEYLKTEIMDVFEWCFENNARFYRAAIRLNPSVEIELISAKKKGISSLDPETRSQSLCYLGKRVRARGSKLCGEIDALLKAIERTLEPAVAANLYAQKGDYLVNKVCFDLRQAGFIPWEIADLLNGKKPLARDKVGGKFLLSETSVRASKTVQKRIERHKKSLKK